MGHAVVKISPEFLLMLFTPGAHPTGYTVVAQGIPLGAVVKDARHRYDAGGIIELVIEHPSLPEVTEGAPYPEMIPVMRAGV